MSRKMIVAGVASLGLLLSACGSNSDAGDSSKITFASYGGETQDFQAETLQEPFTEKTGIQVENASPPDIGKIRPQIESGNVKWDVASTGFDILEKYCGKYFMELPDDLIDPKAVYGDMADAYTNNCGIAHYTAPSIQFYNTELFADNPPDSLEDVFDTEKYPGTRIFLPYVSTGILEIALLADGVPADDLYPLDVDRAFEKLDTIREDSIFPDSYGELQQAYASGNVAIGFSTPSRAAYTIEDGAPYEPVWDKTVSIPEYFATLKGAPNVDGAMEYLKYTAQAEPQAAEAEKTGLPPVNVDAKPEYSEVQKELDVNQKEHLETVISLDAEWWGKHTDEMLERFTAWKVG